MDVAVEIPEAKLLRSYGAVYDRGGGEARREPMRRWLRFSGVLLSVAIVVLLNIWSQYALKPSLRATEYGGRHGGRTRDEPRAAAGGGRLEEPSPGPGSARGRQ